MSSYSGRSAPPTPEHKASKADMSLPLQVETPPWSNKFLKCCKLEMQDPFSGLDTTTGEMKMTNEDGSPEHLVLSLNKEDEVRVESKLH